MQCKPTIRSYAIRVPWRWVWLSVLVLCVLVGCQPTKDYVFLPNSNELNSGLPDNITIDFAVKGSFHNGHPEDPAVRIKEPYSVSKSCGIFFRTSSQWGHPIALLPTDAYMYIIQADGETKKMNLTNTRTAITVLAETQGQINPVPYEVYRASDMQYDTVGISFEYMDHGSFISDRVVHAETDRIGCRIAFTGVYQSGIQIPYTGEVILYPQVETR